MPPSLRFLYTEEEQKRIKNWTKKSIFRHLPGAQQEVLQAAHDCLKASYKIPEEARGRGQPSGTFARDHRPPKTEAPTSSAEEKVRASCTGFRDWSPPRRAWDGQGRSPNSLWWKWAPSWTLLGSSSDHG